MNVMENSTISGHIGIAAILFCFTGWAIGIEVRPDSNQTNQAYTETTTPLVRFDNEVFHKGWRPNTWGGGTCQTQMERYAAENKFPVVLKITFNNTKATLSNTGLFHSVKAIISNTPAGGIYIWCRGRIETKGEIIAAVRNRDAQGHPSVIAQSYLRENDGEWHYARLPFFNNAAPAEDLSITFGIHGSGALEIGEIGLFCAYRPMPDARVHPKILRLPPANSPIDIDGRIDEPAWAKAAFVDLSLPEKGGDLCQGQAPKDKTRVFIAWRPEGIYCAARCHKLDMRTLKANYRADSPDIWHDECVELSFDPDRTSAYPNLIKFTINANGKLGVHNYEDKDTSYRVASGTYDDRWETEFFISSKALNLTSQEPHCLGFNARRITYANENIAEDTGWTTRRYSAVKDFGVLLLDSGANPPPMTPLVNALQMGRARQGSYVITGQNASAVDLRYILNVFSPSAGQRLARRQGTLAPGAIELPFQFPVNEEGLYNVCLLIYDAQKNIHEFFEARPAEETASMWQPVPVDDIALFPEPKLFRRLPGVLPLDNRAAYMLVSSNILFCARHLCDELKAYYGLEIKAAPDASDAAIILDLGAAAPGVQSILKKQKLEDTFKEIKHDGFLVAITDKQILVTARQERGVLYGVNALLDLIKMTSGDVGPARVCRAVVADWPAFALRHWHHMLWGSHPSRNRTPSIYDDILDRVPLRFRYNGLMLEVGNMYQWACDPKVGRAQGWTPEEYRQVIRFANDRYVPVIPFMETLGHANWLLETHKELSEDGDPHTFCTRHPQSYAVLCALADEMIEMCGENPKYSPEYFHIGLDEVRWTTPRTAPEQQCRYCKGIAKNEIFIEHIIRMHDYLKQKGLRTAMYSDMVVKEHNGLNLFQCADVCGRLPRDVIMCHWLGRLENPSIPRFHKLGIENWKTTTAYQLDRLYEDQTAGRAFMCYSYNWWLSFTRNGFGGGIYGPLAQAIYANACWNLYPDDNNGTWRKYERIYGNQLMRNWSRKPLPKATSVITPVDLEAVINETVVDDAPGDGKGWFDLGKAQDLSQMKLTNSTIHGVPTRFAQKGDCAGGLKLSKLNKRSAVIPMGNKAGSLILLHAAYLDIEKDSASFRKRENYPDPLKGLPIARYTVKYADGGSAVFEALYGWNVAQWVINPLVMSEVFSKYILDARALVEGHTRKAKEKNMSADIALYQCEWPNPRPDAAIESITVEGLGTYVDYALLAMSARGVKEK